MNLKIAQVIGLNTDQQAAQATSFTRDGTTFLAVLELSSDDAFTKGRQALSELEDFYFESDGGAAEKLTATFKEAESKLADGESSLCLAAISGKVLYLIGKGQVEIYLKRNDKLSPLLSVGTPSHLISGFIEAQDRLLFSTKSLINFLGEDLNKSLSLPIETFEDEVEGKLGVSDPSLSDYLPTQNQGLAAVAVEVYEEEPAISAAMQKESEPSVNQNLSSNDSSKRLVKSILYLIPSKSLKLIKRIKEYFPKSGRGRLVIAAVLIIIVGIGIAYQYKTSRDKAIQAEFSRLLGEVKENFEAAKGLSSLTPTEAKNKLDLAKDKLNKALVLKSKDSDALSLRAQIEKEQSSILQESSVSDFPLFLDLDLIKKNFRASQMSLSGGKLLLLDPGVKTLVVVDLAKKSNQILAGSEKLGEAVFASLNGQSAFIYSKDKGILKIDITNSKLSPVSQKDSDLGDLKDIYGFAGNVYTLDASKGKIWKYLPTSSGYSDKREYFSKDTTADLSSVIRMQIESSVYVLKSSGEILRFTKGDKDNFSYSGLPSGVKDPKSIFTSSDTEDLYVLDSGNSRLLILTKTGGFKGQITGSKFASGTDVAVDEEEKKVYLLDGSKIYSVDLK